MGNLYDYFRAPSPEDAAAIVGGGPARHFDTVESLEPAVELGRLIAFARGVEWTVGLVGYELLTGNNDIPYEEWEHDAWVNRIADDIRDTLADIPAADQPALAQRWEGIEELSQYTKPLNLLPQLRELVALAGRARDAGQHLYVWVCL